MTETFEPLLPLELADAIIKAQRLPKGDDGVTPLAVPVDKVRELLGLAITTDRTRPAMDYEKIAAHVLERSKSGEVWTLIGLKNLAVAVLNYAQSLGARFEKKQITEEDYREACDAAHEMFTSVLKDKGYLQ